MSEKPTGNLEHEPLELRDLPPEVIALVHAVDAMWGIWAETDDAGRKQLWQRLHQANDRVWHRHADQAGDVPDYVPSDWS
ncbi:MAG: hypothetical protein K0Q93_3148 [Nocardioidaceae bacterium]|jgi:hypothetical protein|nr:hypothetical protein [Nocardioidaceae bacterium]